MERAIAYDVMVPRESRSWHFARTISLVQLKVNEEEKRRAAILKEVPIDDKSDRASYTGVSELAVYLTRNSIDLEPD
jgi:hypothetical protein